MGTAIGQTAAALVRLDAGTVRRRARAGEDRLSGQGSDSRSEEPETRAGFGVGTLSPQSAALKTVSTNLQRARELVPTVEELQARARAASAEAAAKLEVSEAARENSVKESNSGTAETPTLVTARPKAEPLARLFSEERPAAVEQAGGVTQEAAAAPPQGVATIPTSNNAEQRDGASALLDVLA